MSGSWLRATTSVFFCAPAGAAASIRPASTATITPSPVGIPLLRMATSSVKQTVANRPMDDANHKPLTSHGATAASLVYARRGDRIMRGAARFKIVSGGQTGADRAALDWAIERGVE